MSLDIIRPCAAVLVGGATLLAANAISGMVVPSRHLARPAIQIAAAPGEVAAPVEVAVAAASGVKSAAAPAAEAPLPPIVPLLAKADPAAGAAIAKRQCAACHSFNEGGKAAVGPGLYGVVMRASGAQPGFAYSAALKTRGGAWDFETLNRWLKTPAAVVPGTKMTFAGLANDQQRADVIVYLRTLAAQPVPLPEP